MSASPTDLVLTEGDVQAVLGTLRSGWLTMGPRTQVFEVALAELLEVPHVVAVCSWTAALHLGLLAAGTGPGDEVLVSALGFARDADAVRLCGATPVPVDVRSTADLDLDPRDVAAKVRPRTTAILATHAWGYPCDLAALQAIADEHGLTVVEDAAEAISAELADGRKAGTASTAGCFSLSSEHQLAVGGGGFVATRDEAVATKVRSLRSHAMTSVTWDRHRGHAETYDVLDVGFNYRLDEPRAALGLSRLARLRDDVAARGALVRGLHERLGGLGGLAIPWGDDVDAVARSSHSAFVVLLPDPAQRDLCAQALRADGVQSAPLGARAEPGTHGPCPVADEVASRGLALPLGAGVDEAQLDLVAAAVRTTLA